MKITSILTLAAMLLSSVATSQSCDLPVKEGQQYSLTTLTYDVPLDVGDSQILQNEGSEETSNDRQAQYGRCIRKSKA